MRRTFNRRGDPRSINMIKAVIVGINAYPTAPLAGCVNDARDVIDYLSQLGARAENVAAIYDGQATKAAIITALRDMVSASSPGDHLLFHYSGHGSQVKSADLHEPDGLDECLCPVNFSFQYPETAFRDNELATILASVP